MPGKSARYVDVWKRLPLPGVLTSTVPMRIVIRVVADAR